MRTILLVVAVLCFLLGAIVGFGWATVERIDGVVMSGLAAFAASFLVHD